MTAPPQTTTGTPGLAGGMLDALEETVAPPPPPPLTGARAWMRAVRVRQWPKNVLVVAAPAAAGVLLHAHALLRVADAFVVFCLLASGVYLLNDVHHPPADMNGA